MTLVIFDCDGVLVDSEVILNRIDAKTMTDYGYPITTEECIKRFTGMNYKTVIDTIFEETGLKMPYDIFKATHTQIEDVYKKELKPLVFSALDCLKQMGIRRSVASSSPRDRVIKCLEISDQLQYFEDPAIFTSQQVTKGKPAPDLFLFAAKMMGFDPKNCIVVEDSPAGIEAAKAAHMKPIGFLGGAHTVPDWYQNRIKTYNVPIAKTSEELISLLKKELSQMMFVSPIM